MLVLVACGGSAWAQSPEGAQTSTTTLVPPRPIGETSVGFPENAERLAEPVEVKVLLGINEEGEVDYVRLLQSSGLEVFDHAVLHGALRFRFSPARYGGQPVPVEVDFKQRFESPPEPIVHTATTTLDALLVGVLQERGVKSPVAFARVKVWAQDRVFEVSSDERGIFVARIPHGDFKIEIDATGLSLFRQVGQVKANQRLELGYILERRDADPYAVTVIGKRNAKEISRTQLRGREIQQIPGTFGDPFRVVQTLPGVTTLASLLPFPIVRGSSPGNTGFLIDGTRVPLLFHLLAGPSVLHPELIDEIEFFPGMFSVEHGGYVGGIVNGRTRRNTEPRNRLDIDLNLLQAGGFARYTIPGTNITASLSGRYGWPGALISLINPDISLNYWDYQARVDGGDRSSGWSVFVFGASDTLKTVPEGALDQETVSTLRLLFHQLSLRYERRDGEGWDRYQLDLGYNETLSEATTFRTLNATPRALWARKILDNVEARVGLEAFARQNRTVLDETSEEILGFARSILGSRFDPDDELFAMRWSAEALWRPHPRVLVRPGVRLDLYDNGEAIQVGVDPRLLFRWRLNEGSSAPLALKGGVGVYHQPPRFVIPLPGFDQIAFEQGLLRSVQSSLGLELPIEYGFSVDLQTYYNHMDPLLFDLVFNASSVGVNPPVSFPGIDPPERPSPPRSNDEVLRGLRGRSYGMEILLRRRSASGVFGWISYTLSRSERIRNGEWVTFDFDRTHIFNLVAGIPLPRGWSIGFRINAQSGRPLTTSEGLNTDRAKPFFRFDLRIDKRATWNDFLLDFYVDVKNVVLSAEEIAVGNEFRYVLPTLGVRAIYY